MLSRVLNTILLVGILFSIIYGIVIIAKYKDTKPIFKVSLIAMIAFFISRLFFLVLDLSQGNENEFSVGVLGQVAGYLFIMLANTAYLPFEIEKQKFNFKAALIVLIPIACYVYCIIVSHSLSSVVCSILYLSSTCISLYFVFRNLLLIKKDNNFKQLKYFNISILALIFVSTIENILVYFSNPTLQIILKIICLIIAFASSIIALPLLHKGVNKHDC